MGSPKRATAEDAEGRERREGRPEPIATHGSSNRETFFAEDSGRDDVERGQRWTRRQRREFGDRSRHQYGAYARYF